MGARGSELVLPAPPLSSTRPHQPNIPDPSDGYSRGPGTGSSNRQNLLSPNANVLSLDRSPNQLHVSRWNFGIQRELAAGWLLDVAACLCSAQG
jgi:hypothetical protein